MASGKMLGGEGSRENHRWAESKVYSRKTHNKSTSRKSGNPPPHSAADDVNSSHHPSSPAPPLPAASEDEASSLNRPLQALINRNHSNRHFQQHHRMATISLASRSREEVRDLRQKLAAELELVRAMVRKLEARESQAAATASASLAPAAGYTLSQLSASDPNPNVPAKKTALSSEVASCRPQVSVSVVPGESSLNEGAEKEKRTPKANQYYRNSEFLLGKERLPPLEPHGHKKQKVNGSKAVAMGEMDRGSFANAFNSCRDLLSKLMKHKHGWVFNVPVDVKKLNIPDYYSIIKRPMDLGTINSRLNKNWYKAPGEFAEDVRLTFRNAMTYNPKGQDVHHMAEQLLNMFEERWPSIEGQYSNVLNPSSMVKKGQPLDLRSLERSDSTAHPGPVETKSRVVSNAQHHIGRPPPLKKPKAKDPDKRDMTFEEKQRLSNNLQNLPPEKLENIVQIIKKRNSSLSQHDDEIEVDIDSVDVETLWELDRFVTNYKKSLSKNKRKEKLAVLARTGVESNVNERVHEVIPGPEAAGEHREGKTVMDEKEVSSGSRIREENKGRNASRSSSSSSSSSDSGSSSSDSDSESSSAYGSDGGQSPRP